MTMFNDNKKSKLSKYLNELFPNTENIVLCVTTLIA